MSASGGDQTRGDSTLFLDVSRPVALSRGEVAALCLKAARGAGMNWGLAEEAGHAAAWLAGCGIDGPALLLAHLTEAQGREWREICPTVAAGEWRASPGRSLCPIALGATLCDHFDLPEGLGEGRALNVGPVDRPALLIPFLAAVAEAAGGTLGLEWQGGSATVGGRGDWLPQAALALDEHRHLSLRLTVRAGETGSPPLAARLEIDAHTLAGLNALAMRTTVPASAASRAGAGASSSDND